ncbi:sterol desaturase family protein [Polyangium sp. y55x31]|uniref:sterol desaturase family protein n=1 Tax=Polyangium sp. y55x31 TaxID=3042688 RepID=UPI0024829757|nr:sterol desaturase family protein [Polyangium sp. y55x31]MDI1477484.1 sterol desaturase family protein [Polyangium sp. y55x31]
MAPPHVLAFRGQDRAERRPSTRAAGWTHFAFTSLASLAVIIFAASHVERVRLLEALVVPSTFLFANLVEYLVHRGPMHRRKKLLPILYERHTLRHHRFFTREAMACDSAADFPIVLFPPVMILVVLGGVALPVALLLFAVATPNAGWLFVATAMAYFLTYEWLHFAYHLPERSLIAKSRLVRALRQRHALHHDLGRMAHENFNITFPLCDWLFGTLGQQRNDDREG